MQRRIIYNSKYQYAEIVPFFDIHLGSNECDEELFLKSIAYIRNRNHCFTFLGGDLIECNVYGGLNNVHSQKFNVDDQVEKIVQHLYPIRNKILFSVCGNHEYRIEKQTGLNLSKLIADRLDIPYMDWECHFLLKFKDKFFRCFAHHGTGGSSTSGAKLNSAERLHFRSPFANLIISGHLHTPINSEKEIRFLDNRGSVKEFSQHCVLCGSYHKSDGYASKGAFTPVNTCGTKIRITPTGEKFLVEVGKIK